MDNVLSLLGVVFSLFLVLSAAVEAIAEKARIALERLGAAGWLRPATVGGMARSARGGGVGSVWAPTSE